MHTNHDFSSQQSDDRAESLPDDLSGKFIDTDDYVITVRPTGGADRDSLNSDGFPSLIRTIFSEKLEEEGKTKPMITFLLENGASPNQRDATGKTVVRWLLDYISFFGKKYILDFIEKYQPDLDITDISGKSFYHDLVSRHEYAKLIPNLFNRADFHFDDKEDNKQNTPLVKAMRTLRKLVENCAHDEMSFEEDYEEPETIVKYITNIMPLILACRVTPADRKNTILSTVDLARNVVAIARDNPALQQGSAGIIIFRLYKLIQLKAAYEIISENPIAYEKTHQDKLDAILHAKDDLISFLCKKMDAEPFGDNNVFKKIQQKIRDLRYFDFNFLHLYELLQQLLHHNENEIEVNGRDISASSPINLENYFFTFLQLNEECEPWYLTEIQNNPPVNYLITSLVYEAKRHPWESEECQLYHRLIPKIAPQYVKMNSCDVLLVSSLNKKNPGSIPTRAEFCYLRFQSDLYYLDKGKNKLEQITLTAEKRKAFDKIAQPENQSRTLSADQLDQIHEITGHLHCLERYEAFLQEIEKDNYFGENISSDSDSEEEKSFLKGSQREKYQLNNYANEMLKRAQPDKILTKEGTLYKKLSCVKYDLGKRQNQVREIPQTVTHDLAKLNMLVGIGKLNAETLKMIHTKFCVAQYRGIGYRTDHFSKKTRKSHRDANEIGKPQFSMAVLERCNYAFFSQYFTEFQDNPELENKLVQASIALNEKLLQLKCSGPVTLKFIGESYTFDNALLALQDVYTKNYDKFHQLLKCFYDKFYRSPQPGLDALQDLEQAIILSIQSAFSPFVSTSDMPDHALRYAYGKKFYQNYKEARLRPRWRKDGKAERPYAGKVYLSLHDPLELISQSHHVVSLHNLSQIHIDIQTLAERETTFFGYMPADHIKSQHVAKFPSFKGQYKTIYLKKYGLDKTMYALFQAEILQSAPHSTQRKMAKDLLTEHLISYQEVCLLEEAEAAAREADQFLIYRDEFGTFNFYPCQASEPSRSKDEAKQVSLEATRAYIKDNSNRRKNLDSDKSGFLNGLLQQFNVIPLSQDYPHLINYLAQQLGLDANTLRLDYQAFFEGIENNNSIEVEQKLSNFFVCLSKKYSSTILVHSPDYDDNCRKFGDANQGTVVHLYSLGGGAFAGLQSKTHEDENDGIGSVSEEQSETSVFPGSSSSSVDSAEKEPSSRTGINKKRAAQEDLETIETPPPEKKRRVQSKIHSFFPAFSKIESNKGAANRAVVEKSRNFEKS